VSDRREPELSCTENQCPQCRNTVAMYSPGPRTEHNITFRLCPECRNKNCWTDYWEDRRPLQMTTQEAIDTYDENQKRARRRNNRNEGRE
jgi:Zn-finger nucleic acid-binding protein